MELRGCGPVLEENRVDALLREVLPPIAIHKNAREHASKKHATVYSGLFDQNLQTVCASIGMTLAKMFTS